MIQPPPSPDVPPKPQDFNPAYRLHLKFLLVMTGIVNMLVSGQRAQRDTSGRVDAQSGLLLECRLVGGLSALVVRAVVRGNVRVVRRVKELRVDAVRDAPEIGATLL